MNSVIRFFGCSEAVIEMDGFYPFGDASLMQEPQNCVG